MFRRADFGSERFWGLPVRRFVRFGLRRVARGGRFFRLGRTVRDERAYEGKEKPRPVLPKNGRTMTGTLVLLADRASINKKPLQTAGRVCKKWNEAVSRG